MQISVRKPKIKKDKKNIPVKLHKDLFYVHSVHEFHIQILVLTLILISLGANFFSSLNSLSPNPKIENFRYMESYSHVLHFHTLTIELNDTFPFNLDRTLTSLKYSSDLLLKSVDPPERTTLEKSIRRRSISDFLME